MKEHRKPHLFRWPKHWQLDIPWFRGWLSLGWCWSREKRRNASPLVAYWSPDATPCHERAVGFMPTI